MLISLGNISCFSSRRFAVNCYRSPATPPHTSPPPPHTALDYSRILTSENLFPRCNSPELILFLVVGSLEKHFLKSAISLNEENGMSHPTHTHTHTHTNIILENMHSIYSWHTKLAIMIKSEHNRFNLQKREGMVDQNCFALIVALPLSLISSRFPIKAYVQIFLAFATNAVF